jgi:hypothetical protein
MFAEHADTFLADWGSPTSWTPSTGGATVDGLVIFDQPEQGIEGGDVQSRQYMATLATATWLGLKRGEVLVIQGEGLGASYKLRTDPRPQDDGVFSTVQLTRV